MRPLLKATSLLLLLAVAASVAAFYLLPTVGCTPPVYSAPQELVLAPDGNTAYLNDRVARRLLVLSLTEKRVVANAGLPAPTSAMAVRQDGKKIYLLSMEPAGKVFVVDAASDQLERAIDIDGNPTGLAVSTDGTRLFTVLAKSHQLAALDSASGKLMASAALDCTQCRISASPDGKTIAVAHEHGLTVFDAQTLALAGAPETQQAVAHAAFSRDGKTLAYGGANVHFLNLATGALETRATLMPADALSFNADGTQLIAADARMPQEPHGSLSIMAAHIPEEVKGAIVPSVPPDQSNSVALDGFPLAVVVEPRHNNIAVVLASVQGAASILLLDGSTYRPAGQIALPDAKTGWDRFLAWRENVLARQDAHACH